MSGDQVQIFLKKNLTQKLAPKVSSMLLEHNLNFNRLCKLEKLLDGFDILHCGGGQSYLSNETIFTQNKFTVSKL